MLPAPVHRLHVEMEPVATVAYRICVRTQLCGQIRDRSRSTVLGTRIQVQRDSLE